MMSYKTRKELAVELKISYQTLRRRLKESELKIASRRYLTPKDQLKILEYLKASNESI